MNPTCLVDFHAQQLGWRIAVLPFRSSDAQLEHGLALGLAEEVSGALARFRSPRLVATATFWDGAGPVADTPSRARACQLDYIVDGVMRISGKDVQVEVRLLDVVLDFEVIWAGRLDGRLTDLYALQIRLASAIVAQIDPDAAIGIQEEGLIRTGVADAHHAVLGAIQAIFRMKRAGFMRARTLLERAMRLDPDYAAAHTWTAYWSIMAVGQGWVERPGEVTTLAGASADRAVELDPTDARALAIAGHVKSYLLHDVRKALAMHARATELNPNLALAWTLSAWSRIYNGEHSVAVSHAANGKSLSPKDPFIFFAEHALMTAQFFNRHLEEADMLAEVVLERNPSHASALYVRLAILGNLGRAEEAQRCLVTLRRINPHISVAAIVSRPPLRPHDREYYEAGLRRAGVPG